MENTKTISKSKALDTQVKQYIIEAISNTGYELMSFDTPEDKLTFLKNTFKREYGYMIGRIGEQKAFQEWIMGLPTCFSIDFENYEILKLAVKWGYYGDCLTEKEKDKVLSNWFNLITVKTFQLFRKYGIN